MNHRMRFSSPQQDNAGEEWHATLLNVGLIGMSLVKT